MALRLTPRRKEVMVLKCRDGLTNKGIGFQLGISGETVKNIVSAALATNHATSTAGLCWQLSREELFDELARRVLPGSAGDPSRVGCSETQAEVKEVARCTSAVES